MKTSKLQTIIPLLVLFIIGVGFAIKGGLGTTSAIGWGDISLICPLGALGTLLASKLLMPRALVSLAIALILILLVGRAFCSWICPVPVVSKLRSILNRNKPQVTEASKESVAAYKAQLLEGRIESAEGAPLPDELTDEEKALLKGGCASHRAAFDSRHLVLGGSLLSAAIFGFPVFCLVCPIGLSFATVLLLIRLFGFGDVSWSVIIVPALLLVEVVFFRKWCSKICPLSALMSLVARGNRTFKPAINDCACLETSEDKHCGRCAQVCPEGINPRHPEQGTPMRECTRCRACMENCPSHALTLPFLAKAEPSEKASPIGK